MNSSSRFQKPAAAPAMLCFISILLSLPMLASGSVIQTYNFSGAIPYTALDFFDLTFEVIPGTVEIEISHALTDPPTTTNILDWGFSDSKGTLIGWGGGNRENAIIGVTASSRSYSLAPLSPGNYSVVVGKPRIAAPPGHLSVNVTLRDVATLAPQTTRVPYSPCAPLDVPPKNALKWYAGDFHVHSRESGDAFNAASVDEIATFARTTALLDFVHLSEHNTVSSSSLLADAQPRHPQLLLLPGVEYTTYFGHGGALFTSTYVDHRIGLPGVTIQSAAAAIHAQGGLFSINHMYNFESDASDDGRNDCVGCQWDFGGSLSYRDHDIDAMEVGIQSWGGTGWLFIPRALEHWDHLHALGFTYIAPIGGSDDHQGGINETVIGPWREGSPIGSPTTMVLAANLSHAAILEGVKLGRTILKLNNASDPDVDFSASTTGSSGLTTTLVGGTVPLGSKTVTLTATVDASNARARGPELQLGKRLLRGASSALSAAAPDVYLALVRNNEETFKLAISAFPFVFSVNVSAPIGGTDRWRAELHEATFGSLAVLTNHIFITAA